LNNPNKCTGFFYWTGDSSIEEVMSDYGLPSDTDTVEQCKTDLAATLNEDDIDTGAIYRVTVEKIMVAKRPNVVFEKV